MDCCNCVLWCAAEESCTIAELSDDDFFKLCPNYEGLADEEDDA